MTVLAVAFNAVLRFGLGLDLAPISETGGFVFLIVTFLALAGTQVQRQHVAVQMLENVAPQKLVDKIYGYVAPFLALAFMVALTITSTIMTMRYFDTGRTTISLIRLPFWALMSVVPVGSALFSLLLASDLIERFQGLDADGSGDAAKIPEDDL